MGTRKITVTMSFWATLTGLTALLSHFAIAHGANADVKCVTGADGNSYFSVIIHDEGDMKASSKIKVRPTALGAVKCEKPGTNADKIEVDYLATAPTADDYAASTATLSAAGNATDHQYIRVMINLADCAFHEVEAVTAAPDGKASSNQNFTAHLQMSSNGMFFDVGYDLECMFQQTLAEETLQLTANVPVALVDATPTLKAKLSVSVDGINATTPPIQADMGQTVVVTAGIDGSIDVQTAFKYCKVCKDATCTADTQYLVSRYNNDGSTGTAAEEQLNCLNTNLNNNNRFIVKPPVHGTTKTATLQFPAFRFANAIPQDQLILKCAIAICKTAADSACTKQCADSTALSSFRRRRRSVSADPLESTASIAIQIVAPKTASCAPPAPVPRAARRANCTRGANLGSVCRQKCDPGFEGAGGSNAATRICQEMITERVEAIYYGVAPKWNPGKTQCVDINECLKNPCPATSICENTPGSYRCL